jgi:MFS family permease
VSGEAETTALPVDPPAGFSAVLGNPGLRLIEIAWALGIAGDAAFTVALLVSAFAIGGPFAIGILTFVRMAPSVIGAPLAGLLAGRRPPAELLFLVHGVRALGAIGVVLILISGGPVLVGLLAATVAASAGAFVRPLQVATTPAFALTPDELVAANGATSTGEGIGSFVGPLVGGLLILAGGPTAAAVAATLLFVAATVALAGLEPSADDQARRVADRSAAADTPFSIRLVGRELTAGMRVLARRPGPAIVVLGFAGQVFVRGLMTTLTVVAAIRVLGLGEPGVGTLGAAYGLGTLAGAILSVRLAGRARLAPSFAVSLSLWGLPLAVMAAVPIPAVAIAALAVSGIANATLDVAGFTLLQRCVSGGERMPVFGVLESIAGIGIGIGGAVAPLLVEILGDRGALAVSGAILPILAVASWPRLRAVDADVILPERELELLRGIPLFARLPLTALERLAEAMRATPVAAATVLVREGEPGAVYYVIAAGRFEVRQGTRVLLEAGPGEGIGEIALLRAVPRTATVVALEDCLVYSLDSAAFLAAVAGPTSAAAAAAVIDERLARSAIG